MEHPAFVLSADERAPNAGVGPSSLVRDGLMTAAMRALRNVVVGVALATLPLSACATTAPEAFYDETQALGGSREDRLRVGEGTCDTVWEADDAEEPVGEGFDVAYIDLRNAGACRAAAVQVVGASVEHLCPRYADEVASWRGADELHDFLDESCLATSPAPTHPGCPVMYVD